MWSLLFVVAWASTADVVLSDLNQELGVYDQIESTKTNNPFRDVEAFVNNDSWSERHGVEVGIKLKLKPFQEWQLSRADSTNAELIKKFNKSATLKTRFEVLVEYKQALQKIDLYQAMIKKMNQALKLQEIDVVSGKSEMSSLLNSKSSLERYLAELKMTEIHRDNLLNLLTLWAGKQDLANDYSFISLEIMQREIIKLPHNQKTLTDQLRQEEMSQIEKEIKILRARDRQWLNEFEIKRSNIRREEDYEVGLKFRIPVLSSDSWARQKMNELLIKKTLKQRELREQAILILDLSNKINADIDRYKRQVQGAKKTLELTARGALETQIKQLGEQIESVSLLESIYLQYIYLLFEVDRLQPQYLIGSHK